MYCSRSFLSSFFYHSINKAKVSFLFFLKSVVLYLAFVLFFPFSHAELWKSVKNGVHTPTSEKKQNWSCWSWSINPDIRCQTGMRRHSPLMLQTHSSAALHGAENAWLRTVHKYKLLVSDTSCTTLIIVSSISTYRSIKQKRLEFCVMVDYFGCFESKI